MPRSSPVKTLFAFVILGLWSSGLATPNLSGTWVGHVHFTVSPRLKGRRKAIFALYSQRLNKMVVTYHFHRDHTYESTSTAGAKLQHDHGKWSQVGKQVTVVDPQGTKHFSIEAGGQKLLMQLPSFHGLVGDMTLSRVRRR